MTVSARGRPVRQRRTAASKMVILAVCLFGAAGMVWVVLPASEAGGYGAGWIEGVVEEGATHAGAAAPVKGTLSAYVGDVGGVDAGDTDAKVEGMARVIAKNWLDGTITYAEYIGAMSYLYGQDGYAGVGEGGTGTGVRFDVARGGVDDAVDGPVGSAQGWCKDGLEARTNAFTGDMVCVPDGYADGEDGARWIEPRTESVDSADGSRDEDKYNTRSSTAAEPAWQWRPSQDGSPHFGGKGAGTYESGLKEKIADLEEINEGLMRTVAKLQEALIEIHLEGRGGDGAATAGVVAGVGAVGQVKPREDVAPAVSQDGDACLHGTGATFTSVIDPTTLAESGGSLGTIPLPDGRYTVLLMAASSVPVSVSLQLDGDAGLEYDRMFTLADTGMPPGEDETMWDYNSGAAELVVAEPQLANATAAVSGGDGLPVFAALARCK